ncbi:hypothetical protein [Sinorhizobium psoraleae]|uniref:Uncharacterized protein n=1 Tax=Sinorhizobium psoraleae TaxID=520838 RepID=A0ABT4KA32_9HYPH|nr:hypothetical protein [Sinorhizobium psoraleae]MCZ4088819.1 hypothetical protein [Sinorhizobium psoraleae]
MTTSVLQKDWLTDRIPAEVTEQMLRERYDLTKSQVNDVLMRASREGWAERKQGYGWRFLPVAKTPEAFEQIYRFRMLIEPAAMLEPEFRLDRKIIEEQRRIQLRMLETDIERLPAERLLHNGALFHEELIKMSNNPFFPPLARAREPDAASARISVPCRPQPHCASVPGTSRNS